MLKRIIIFQLALVLSCPWTTTLHAADAPATGKPSLCFVTEWAGQQQDDVPYVDELRKAGFQIDNMGIQNLTLDKMRQYNALIIPEFPVIDPLLAADSASAVRPATVEKFYAAIDDYVKNGGGLIVYAVQGGDPMNVMLKPWGAQRLFEQVYDPKRHFQYKGAFHTQYMWTENMAANPLTDGVKRIYYPVDDLYGPTTYTFQLSPEWTVLARGDAEAYSVLGNRENDFVPGFFPEKKGTYTTAPPLIAVRDYGKGRIAVVGLSAIYAVFGARAPCFGGVVLDAGDGNVPSDYGKLQQRLYRWVAEPALLAGSPGGYVDKPPTYAANSDLSAPPIDWKTFTPHPGSEHLNRGLIGAQTQDGGGTGSVADYVAAAAVAGLDYIVFAEDFTRLDAAKWSQFRKTCQEASTAKVTAIPGFLYRDNTNSRWIAAGDFDFPGKSFQSPDGKRLIGPTWWFPASFPLNTPIDVGHNPRPFWTYTLYSAMAVKTFENGKLVDDATPAYLDRQEIEAMPAPLTVDLMTSPRQVAQSATHFTGVYASDPTALRKEFSRGAGNGDRFFSSTGPLITDWRGFNTTRTTQGRWEPVPGTERWAASFTATSAVGLREVFLMDGPHVLRRFDAGGAKTFSQVVNLLHDRQRHILVIVKDLEGQVAISGQLYWNCDQLYVRRFCSDRGNTIVFNVLRTEKGRVYVGAPAAPYQRTDTMFTFFPGFADLPNRFFAPFVDGGLRPVCFESVPSVMFQGIKPRAGTFASRMANPLASRDVIIQESDLIGWFSNRWADSWKPADMVEPASDYTATIRWISFGERYHDPGLVLMEGTLTFLHDGELDPAQAINPDVFCMRNDSSDFDTPMFSIVDGPQGSLSGQTSQTQGAVQTGPIAKGGFVTLYPDTAGSGVIFALDDGYQVDCRMLRPTAFVTFGPIVTKRSVKKGEQLHYRALIGRGILGEPPTDQEWHVFRDAMGISGAPAYKPVATQGKILSTNFLLEGQTVDGGFAATIVKADLPMRLPICVQPVNPKWTAVIANVKDGSFLPIGVIETENKAYATWDPSKQDAEIYVGNIVRCAAPELILTATCAGDTWSVDVHNPSEKSVTATILGVKKFPPLAGLRQSVTVAAGHSVTITAPPQIKGGAQSNGQ